jgi:hypothetical protein
MLARSRCKHRYRLARIYWTDERNRRWSGRRAGGHRVPLAVGQPGRDIRYAHNGGTHAPRTDGGDGRLPNDARAHPQRTRRARVSRADGRRRLRCDAHWPTRRRRVHAPRRIDANRSGTRRGGGGAPDRRAVDRTPAVQRWDRQAAGAERPDGSHGVSHRPTPWESELHCLVRLPLR